MRATLEKARGRQMRIVLDVLKIANRHRGDVVLGEQREPFRGRLRRRLARDFAVDDRHMLALCLGGLEFGRLDRKSVVWGKSVSVRVDLGVRRIIKKKKNTKQE